MNDRASANSARGDEDSVLRKEPLTRRQTTEVSSVPAAGAGPIPDARTGSTIGTAAKSATAQQRAKAVSDPFVQKVKEAVDGTLLEVWPAKDPTATNGEAEPPVDGVADVMTEESSTGSAETDLPLFGME